jgi:predicted ATPase/class 3 adenylate cyclase/ribosomal protein L40E
VNCLQCQAQNPDDAVFCESCGSRLEAVCRNCGATNRLGARFCKKCGHGLLEAAPASLLTEAKFASVETYTPKHLAEKILNSKSFLEGELKQVTVLFADMKGSMELLADRDPEDARKLLNAVIEQMMEAVHRYEGTVNHVLGDGIMALFGAPLAHEDHAIRACYAALRMQESVKRYAIDVQRTQGIPIQIRVGLNSGEVVVGAIRNDLHIDYTAIGQTTHLAARMEQMAMPGSILMTADTLQLAEGYVHAKTLGAVPVKGMNEPVDVYELTGAGAARTRLQAAASRGLTRFIGRDTEMDHLRKTLEQARVGHGQIVAVVGEPGVGKSRLFHEFTRSHRTEGCLIVESGSVSYGKATPYLPVIDLLKAYFRIQDRDNQRDIHEKVIGKLLTLDETLKPTLVPFLALLDVAVEDAQWQALDPSQRRQRTLDACKRLLVGESQAQPLVLVFEDLHWLDSESQTVLDSLVEILPTARLLLLVNYRPEYQHAWASKTFYSQLRLDPLLPEGAKELLESLMGKDPSLQTLKQRLIARTEGNPFFLEESVRTLVEMGVLAGERGQYRLSKPVTGIEVPVTVQAVLTARIDRLGPDEKRLLQCASVIGEDVPFALLSIVADLTEENLRRGLVHLHTAEFLYETKLFPDLEYTFKHGLTCQVAYQSLVQDRRRSLHSAVVEGIERLYSARLTEHVERLAFHTIQGELWDKAVSYLRQSGLKAIERSAHREAVTYLEQALEALRHLPENRKTREQAIDIHLDLRSALHPLGGEQRRVYECLDQAEILAKSLNDPRRLAQVLCYMSAHFIQAENDPARAAKAGEEALEIASSINNFTLQVQASHFLGVANWQLGNYPESTRFLTQNINRIVGDQVYERFGLAFLASVGALYQLAVLSAELGQFNNALSYGNQAVRISETSKHPFSINTAYFGLGYVQLRKGEIDKAISLLERTLELCRTSGIQQNFPRVAANLGYAYAASGRVTEALSLLEQSTERLVVHRRLVGSVGEGYILAGRLELATQFAEQTLESSRRNNGRSGEGLSLRLLGDIVASRNPPEIEKAQVYYSQSIIIATELGMRPLLAHCHVGLGKLYRRSGDLRLAKEHLYRGVALMREMEMGLWLDRAEAELKEVG